LRVCQFCDVAYLGIDDKNEELVGGVEDVQIEDEDDVAKDDGSEGDNEKGDNGQPL
jgi:hypothetical protein